MFERNKLLTEKQMSVVSKQHSEEYNGAVKALEVYNALKGEFKGLKIDVPLFYAPVSDMLKTIFKDVPQCDLGQAGSDDIEMSYLSIVTIRGVSEYHLTSTQIVERLRPLLKKELARFELSKTLPIGVNTGRELAVKLRDAKDFLVPQYTDTKRPEFAKIKVATIDDKVYVVSEGLYERHKNDLQDILSFEAGKITPKRAKEIVSYFFDNRVR